MIILPRRVTCAYYLENWPHSPKLQSDKKMAESWKNISQTIVLNAQTS